MPNYYANLPAPEIRNALLDFAPVNNALEGVRQQNNANRNALMQQQQMDMQRENQQYQRGRDAKQDARVDQKYFADGAQSVMNLPATDPRRAAVWQNLLKRHPNPASLTPDYLDPVKGPEMVLAEYGALADPRDSRMKDLEIGYKQAQINKLQREPAGGEAPSNVREYEYFQRLSPEAQTQYLTMKRAEKYLDTGPAFVRPNPMDATAPPLATIGKNPAEVERQKAIGEAQGKATADLPRVNDNATLALKTINDIRNHPGKALGTGVGGVVPGIPGTQQRGFVNLVEQAKGKTFLEAFNSLRGGGQITENEGAKATQALARLDRAQTPEDFEKSLKDLEEVINLGLSRAKKATGQKFDLGDGFSVEID